MARARRRSRSTRAADGKRRRTWTSAASSTRRSPCPQLLMVRKVWPDGPPSDGGGLRGAALLQPADQIRHIRELLLEVALVALEPLEHVVALVPALAGA